MKKTKRLLLLLAILLPLSARASDADSTRVSSSRFPVIELLDNVVNWIAPKKIGYDTTYLAKPKERWTLKLRTKMAGAHLDTKTNFMGNELEGHLKPRIGSNIGLGVNYRGLAVSAGINTRTFKKHHDHDLSLALSAYTNRIGLEMQYQSTNTFAGKSIVGGVTYPMEPGEIEKKMLVVNTYYAFNYKKFSFPAAFTQSLIQRRSAGSILVGLAAVCGNYHTTYAPDNTDYYHLKSSIGIYGPGAGYGYNVVLGKGWMFHVSAVAHVVAFNTSKLFIDNYSQKVDKSFPDFIIVGRAALVYNHKRTVCSLTGFSNSARIDHHGYFYDYTKWYARLNLGFRIK